MKKFALKTARLACAMGIMSVAIMLHAADYKTLISTAAKFRGKLPKGGESLPKVNLMHNIAGQDLSQQQQMVNDAKSVKILVHPYVIELIEEFIDYKKQHGSQVEQTFYQNMTIKTMICERLPSKRPLTFYTPHDEALLLGESDRLYRGFDKIGTDEESLFPGGRSPLLLKNYLSYDELLLSAFIGIISKTHFINNGARKNNAIPSKKDDYEKHGYFAGLVGARFERENYMECKHILATESQNKANQGYGLTNISNTDKPLGFWWRMWSKFYRVNAFPTYEEAKRDETGRYYLIDNKFFDTQVYKKRMYFVIEPFLIDANERGKKNTKGAYVHVVGLGLGVWAVAERLQAELMLEVYQAIFDKHHLQHISDIDFSWFPDGINEINGIEDGEQLKGNNNHITIHFSKRDVAAKLKGNHEGKLLVAQYPWDSNAFPGNEYWIGHISASGDPAAVACSTIGEIQNPEANLFFHSSITDAFSMEKSDTKIADEILLILEKPKKQIQLSLAGDLEMLQEERSYSASSVLMDKRIALKQAINSLEFNVDAKKLKECFNTIAFNISSSDKRDLHALAEYFITPHYSNVIPTINDKDMLDQYQSLKTYCYDGIKSLCKSEKILTEAQIRSLATTCDETEYVGSDNELLNERRKVIPILNTFGNDITHISSRNFMETVNALAERIDSIDTQCAVDGVNVLDELIKDYIIKIIHNEQFKNKYALITLKYDYNEQLQKFVGSCTKLGTKVKAWEKVRFADLVAQYNNVNLDGNLPARDLSQLQKDLGLSMVQEKLNKDADSIYQITSNRIAIKNYIAELPHNADITISIFLIKERYEYADKNDQKALRVFVKRNYEKVKNCTCFDDLKSWLYGEDVRQELKRHISELQNAAGIGAILDSIAEVIDCADIDDMCHVLSFFYSKSVDDAYAIARNVHIAALQKYNGNVPKPTPGNVDCPQWDLNNQKIKDILRTVLVSKTQEFKAKKYSDDDNGTLARVQDQLKLSILHIFDLFGQADIKQDQNAIKRFAQHIIDCENLIIAYKGQAIFDASIREAMQSIIAYQTANDIMNSLTKDMQGEVCRAWNLISETLGLKTEKNIVKFPLSKQQIEACKNHTGLSRQQKDLRRGIEDIANYFGDEVLYHSIDFLIGGVAAISEYKGEPSEDDKESIKKIVASELFIKACDDIAQSNPKFKLNYENIKKSYGQSSVNGNEKVDAIVNPVDQATKADGPEQTGKEELPTTITEEQKKQWVDQNKKNLQIDTQKTKTVKMTPPVDGENKKDSESERSWWDWIFSFNGAVAVGSVVVATPVIAYFVLPSVIPWILAHFPF